MGPVLRVAPEKAPLCVSRHSFGTTKPRSSCLDWRFSDATVAKTKRQQALVFAEWPATWWRGSLPSDN